MRTIVDTLAEHASRVQDPHELTALVRIALGRAIVQQIWPQAGELQVMALDSGLERLLTQALQANPNGAGIEPDWPRHCCVKHRGQPASGAGGPCASAAGAGAVANIVGAFPAPRAAAAEDIVARRNARFQQY